MKNLLTEKMYNAIENAVDINKITEIRIRRNKQLVVFVLKRAYYIINPVINKPYIVDDFDITYILDIASGHSVYAITEQIVKGYLVYSGGIRIGIIGEGVYVGSNLINIKNISSLVIRVPHEIFGSADNILDTILSDGMVSNTLIIARPSGGKTTLIRELARVLSNIGLNTLIIDERNEIAGMVDGNYTLDVGKNTDIATNIKKDYAYENVIRSMNPDLLITDEIFDDEEIEALYKASCSGVNVIASMHANSLEDIKKDKHYNRLVEIFRYFVILDKENIGKVSKIVRVENNG